MSALFSEASQVAKRVVKSPIRSAIYNALQSITSFSEDQIQAGRTNSLEYYARKQQQQFSALLHLNSSLSAANEQLAPFVQLSPLSEEQHAQFSLGDRFIRAVNARLFEQLRPVLRDWTIACDPYANVGTPEYHAEAPSPDPLLAEATGEIDALLRVWGSHPLITELAEFVQAVPVTDEGTIVSTILMAKRVLEDMPGRPTAVDVQNLRGARRGPASAEANASRLLGGLFLLRKAVSLIDALLYDAFKVLRLPALTSDSVFDIRQSDSDQLGPVLSVDLQPTGGEFSRSRGDLIILTRIDEHFPHGPALIVGQSVSISRATGATITFDLRMLDAWMNPYSHLWQP